MADADEARDDRDGRRSAGDRSSCDPAVFEAPVQPHLFHAEVRRQLARAPRGHALHQEPRGGVGRRHQAVAQKGTGRARQGTIRAPQWAGGGVVFGPVPRGYEHALPKKVRRAALRGALSLRVREGALAVVDALGARRSTRRSGCVAAARGPRPRRAAQGADRDRQANQALERSARNLPRVTRAARRRAQRLRRAAPPKLLTHARGGGRDRRRGSPAPRARRDAS